MLVPMVAEIRTPEHDAVMPGCSVCRTELHGYYEFRDDGAPICLGCFEEYERQLRRATGSMQPMRGDITGSIEPIQSISIEAAEPPARKRSLVLLAVVSVLVVSAIAVAWLV